MIKNSDALLSLLRDDDPSTLRLVKGQLARSEAATLDELRMLLAAADPAAARHLRDVIAAIEKREAESIFAELCATFGEQGDLEDAAWRLAASFTSGGDFHRKRRVLDSWGAEVRRRLRKADDEIDSIETLVEFLGGEVGLRGNTDDYYCIDNSLLPEVIDSRLGNPITLSLVYMLVARRARLELAGIGLPGHFIVRAGELFFDPFHGGRRVGLEECRTLVEEQSLVLTPAHLRPTTPRQMLIRMLGNIYCVAEESDPPMAEKVQNWIGALYSGRRPAQ